MLLDETLMLIAMQLNLNPSELIAFSREDVIGGYHYNPELSKWRQGSIFSEEGRTLYALIRALRSQNVVEIGAWVGCSGAHIATALMVNGEGRLTSVDIDPQTGESFPPYLETIHTTVISDGIEWLAGQEDESIDLLFEDSSHSTDMCASIAALCKTKLAPGGVLLVHDAGHTRAILGDNTWIDSPVGAEVCAGLTQALGDTYRVYLAEPSDCGLAIWQRKAERQAVWQGIDPEIREGWVKTIFEDQHSTPAENPNLRHGEYDENTVAIVSDKIETGELKQDLGLPSDNEVTADAPKPKRGRKPKSQTL